MDFLYRLLNLAPLPITLLTLVLLIKLVLIFHRAYFGSLSPLPGPWYAKLTHYWLKWKVISGQRAQYINSLHQRHGAYVRIAPGEVSISDVSTYQAIYGAGSKFNKSDWYLKFTMVENPHDSPGIFAITDPKAHSERRKLFSHLWSNSSIIAKESIIREKINMAVNKFDRDVRAYGCADMMKWWTFLATDVMAALSFGQSFELLEREKLGADPEQKSQYILDVQQVMMLTGIRAEFQNVFKLAEYLPIRQIQNAFKVKARVDSYGAAAIQKHKDFILSNPTASSSLFARFLDPTRHKSELTDHQLAQEAGNLIVAGADTTSVSLTYLTYALLRPCNKHVLDKLMEEISALPIDAPSKNILALPYLKQVIEESLRLYAGTPSLPRTVPPSGATFGGYFLPDGTTVSSQSYTLMRDPKTFRNPEMFDPSRWDSSTQTMKNAWSPFSIGARGCLGVHLAMFEITCAIFTFLKICPTAQLAPSMKDEDMDFECYFIMGPKGHKLDLVLKG